MDYSKLNEIEVTNQQQLDDIPADFGGRIVIKFGTPFNRAVVKRRYALDVYAYGNSSVSASDNSSVRAYGNSSVSASDNSSVSAYDNSSVSAYGNSSVSASDNSSVSAYGNVQVLALKQGSKIKTSGNARIVYLPKTIFEFMDFYGIEHTKTTAIFYKAVHKVDGKYCSHNDRNFTYEIGKFKTEDCDINPDRNCSNGIHIAHLDWALRFGENFIYLAILECRTKIADIVLPTNSDGKVRTCKVKVLREVPLEECGAYGKILAKRVGK